MKKNIIYFAELNNICIFVLVIQFIVSSKDKKPVIISNITSSGHVKYLLDICDTTTLIPLVELVAVEFNLDLSKPSEMDYGMQILEMKASWN